MEVWIVNGRKVSLLFITLVAFLFLTQVSCQNYGNKYSSSEQSCSRSNCRLPECRCATRTGPQGIQTEDLPQVVMITFDDAVNEQNIDFYRRLFPRNFSRRNPNGCPIAATFFVSHEWTDYKMVRQLYLYGHEIADHSISHRLPRDWWRTATYREWREELVGQRRNIAKKAGVPKSEVRGVRVPFLEIGSDTQFEVLTENNFEYDASFLTGPYNDRDWRLSAWPYTLDFYPTLEYCDSHNCPKTNFSGFWEVPLNRWLGLDGKSCPMVDGCTTQNLRDKRETSRYLWKNFNRHYQRNRAPLGINMHATWFDEDYKVQAMEEFLDDILDTRKVYIVTVHQALAWMRDPTSLKRIRRFAPWLTCKHRRLLVQRRKKTPPPLPKTSPVPSLTPTLKILNESTSVTASTSIERTSPTKSSATGKIKTVRVTRRHEAQTKPPTPELISPTTKKIKIKEVERNTKPADNRNGKKGPNVRFRDDRKPVYGNGRRVHQSGQRNASGADVNRSYLGPAVACMSVIMARWAIWGIP